MDERFRLALIGAYARVRWSRVWTLADISVDNVTSSPDCLDIIQNLRGYQLLSLGRLDVVRASFVLRWAGSRIRSRGASIRW
jgi:hypothetical protein